MIQNCKNTKKHALVNRIENPERPDITMTKGIKPCLE